MSPRGPRLAAHLPRTIAPRRVLTQTIVKPSTTYTTFVTLGPAPPEAFDPPEPTVEIPPAVPETPEPEPEPTIYGSDGQLTSAEIGAILGAVIAFVAIVLLVLHCLLSRRGGDDSDDESSDDETVSRHSRGPRGPAQRFRGRPSDSDSSSMTDDPWGRIPPPPPTQGYRPAARPARAAPRINEVNQYPPVRPVYGNVRYNTRIRRPI